MFYQQENHIFVVFSILKTIRSWARFIQLEYRTSKVFVKTIFYVDKTALIYKLVNNGRYFFLSRPRRFGKSLLISTLEAYFEEKRELFEGLAIEKLEKDWVKRPVLHLDLNTEKYETPESIENILNDTLCQ